jgi:nitrogenase subunit NifH
MKTPKIKLAQEIAAAHLRKGKKQMSIGVESKALKTRFIYKSQSIA